MMILQTFEGFFNTKNQHPLHKILLNFGWTYNKKTERYDKDAYFDMMFSFFNQDGLAWKDGVKFPMGEVEGLDMIGMPIETTLNLPIRIGKSGINLSNTFIKSIGDWSPEFCSGNFSLAITPITDLKGLEDLVLYGDLDLSGCTKLTSLEGIPEMNNNVLDVSNCWNLKTLYGLKGLLDLTAHKSGVPKVEIDFVKDHSRFGLGDYWKELYEYVIEKQSYKDSYGIQWPKELFDTFPEEYKNAYNSTTGINKYNL